MSRTDMTIDYSSPLSRRETEVLRLIAAGQSNKMIGQRLVIAEHSVKNHVTSILRKLGARIAELEDQVAARLDDLITAQRHYEMQQATIAALTQRLELLRFVPTPLDPPLPIPVAPLEVLVRVRAQADDPAGAAFFASLARRADQLQAVALAAAEVWHNPRVGAAWLSLETALLTLGLLAPTQRAAESPAAPADADAHLTPRRRSWRWSDEEIDLLIAWDRERVPKAEIARRLGRSRERVWAKRRELAEQGRIRPLTKKWS